MQALKWLMAICLVLIAGFFVYQWSSGDRPIQEKHPLEETAPSTVVDEEPSERIEPPSSPAAGEVQPKSEGKPNTSSTGSAGIVNPFMAPPKGSSEQMESVDQEGEEQAPETEESEATTRDLLKEVPDSYPIENAETYYVPPEERYPGHLGGPPPLKLPPINAPDSASSPQSDETDENSGDLAPPPSF